jgi:predicted ArsR family transcriptional regulator
MEPSESERDRVDTFVLEHIETVPHMEALLLVWENRPRQWSEGDLAARLFVPADTVRRIMRNLADHGLITAKQAPDPVYGYRSQSAEGDQLMEAVAATYRRELVRVSTMIHAKTSSAVRAFARAFEFGRRK